MNFRTGSTVDGLPLITTQQIQNLISNFLKSGTELEGQITVINTFKLITNNNQQFSIYKDNITPTVIINTVQTNSTSETLRLYGSQTIDYNLLIKGNTNINGTLEVTGSSTFNGQTTINNNMTVTNTLTQNTLNANKITSSTLLQGNIHSDNLNSYSDTNSVKGYWLGKDSSNPKVFIGNKSDQKYLEFDSDEIYYVGNQFGHFYGDIQTFNLEIKSQGTIIQDQNSSYIYKFTDGKESIKQESKGKHHIISLQNQVIKPQNQYSPLQGGESEGQLTSWYTVNTSSQSSGGYYYLIVSSGSNNTIFYKVELQLYKKFPSNYFKGSTSSVNEYQTLIFDFSDILLYNTTYSSNLQNKIKVSYNPSTREVKVDVLDINGSLQYSKIQKQKQDIDYLKFRCYKQTKSSTQSINNDMQLTITTKEQGHQLVSIQIDGDQIADDNINTKFDTNILFNNTYGIINQRTFNGVQTQQYFQDLQEYIWVNENEQLKSGTPVQIKNGKLTKQYNPWKKFWIISTNPGFIMGKGRKNQIPIQLQGTVEVSDLDQSIDDEICISFNGKLKKQTLLDKLLFKYIVGRVIKILDNGKKLILIY